MLESILNPYVLPLIFAGIMGLAVVIYIVLDGYDLGVGILASRARPEERDIMIASIGPFWDANETWLVLAVGVLLVAFPVAHGIILTQLYMPVAVMLIGLALRGVAFEFRVKDSPRRKNLWDAAFIGGSLVTTLAQGYMLGMYIVGFERTLANVIFALATGVCLAAGYASVGASWLIMKTKGTLQKRAVAWAQRALWGVASGMAAVSLATPSVSGRIFDKWFTMPQILYLVPLPLLSGCLVLYLHRVLARLPQKDDRGCWVPFAGNVLLFIACFVGLAYSFFPYVVPDKLTVWQSASSVAALSVILIGAAIVVPMILAYTVYAYRVFWGKVDKALSYH